MKQVPYNQYAEHALNKMAKGGVFLTVKKDDQINTMTMGWGSISFYWGKPVFIVPVRFSRHTHLMLDATDEFTVTVPKNDELKEALVHCGTHSGRDENKFAAMNLTPLQGLRVDCPVIAQGYLHYECKVIGKFDLTGEFIDDGIVERYYKDNDYHTFYIGEIVECYVNED